MYVAEARFVIGRAPASLNLAQFATIAFAERIDPAIKHQIATAAEEQTATTTEISGNLHRINEVIIHTASGAQESASAAGQLARLAEELKRLVGQFKLAA